MEPHTIKAMASIESGSWLSKTAFEKIRHKHFVHVFLIENSCLNCLKVDRIQDYIKKIYHFYFVIKSIPNLGPKPSLKSEKETISPAQSTGLGWRRLPPEIAAGWRWVPLIKKMTIHYNSQFFVRFHYCFHWEG